MLSRLCGLSVGCDRSGRGVRSVESLRGGITRRLRRTGVSQSSLRCRPCGEQLSRLCLTESSRCGGKNTLEEEFRLGRVYGRLNVR